jgi:hypothetical protein
MRPLSRFSLSSDNDGKPVMDLEGHCCENEWSTQGIVATSFLSYNNAFPHHGVET